MSSTTTTATPTTTTTTTAPKPTASPIDVKKNLEKAKKLKNEIDEEIARIAPMLVTLQNEITNLISELGTLTKPDELKSVEKKITDLQNQLNDIKNPTKATIGSTTVKPTTIKSTLPPDVIKSYERLIDEMIQLLKVYPDLSKNELDNLNNFKRRLETLSNAYKSGSDRMKIAVGKSLVKLEAEIDHFIDDLRKRLPKTTPIMIYQ